MCVIRIGGEQAEYVAIKLLGRSHPGCQDYWDGNWLREEVEVLAGGFRGLVTGDLRTDEFDQVHEQLSRLHETLQGTAADHRARDIRSQQRLENAGQGTQPQSLDDVVKLDDAVSGS